MWKPIWVVTGMCLWLQWCPGRASRRDNKLARHVPGSHTAPYPQCWKLVPGIRSSPRHNGDGSCTARACHSVFCTSCLLGRGECKWNASIWYHFILFLKDKESISTGSGQICFMGVLYVCLGSVWDQHVICFAEGQHIPLGFISFNIDLLPYLHTKCQMGNTGVPKLIIELKSY